MHDDGAVRADGPNTPDPDTLPHTNDTVIDSPTTATAAALYPTHLFTKFSASFWLMALSFFCLFLSYNCIQNLASTVHGNKGSIAIAVLYVFFIISNFFAPAVLPWVFKNDASLMMFCGSICYTIFAIANIYARLYTLIPAAVIVGLSGGPIWVGYGVFTTSFARYMAEHSFLLFKKKQIAQSACESDVAVVTQTDKDVHGVNTLPQNADHAVAAAPQLSPSSHDHPQHLPSSASGYLDDTTQRINTSALTAVEMESLDLTTSSLTASFTTICWFVMNLNTAFGGLIAYFVLDSSDDSDLNSDSSIVRILFVIFSAVCVVANIAYYLTYYWTPAPTYINVDQLDSASDDKQQQQQQQQHVATTPQNTASPQHTPTSSDQQTIVSNQTDVVTMSPTTSTAMDQKSTNQDSDANSHLASVLRSMRFMIRVIRSRVIYLSIPTFFSAGLAFNFYYSAFLSNAVDPTLGTATVSLMTIIAASTDALVALIINRFMTSFRITQWCSLIGNCIQVLSMVLILVLPFEDWSSDGISWRNSVIISVVAGIGDAIHISGLYSAVGIICEANTYTRSSGHAVLQAFKGLGSSFLFLTSAVMEYDDQTYLMTAIITVSVVFQAINMVFYQPLDLPYIMGSEHPASHRGDPPGDIEKSEAEAPLKLSELPSSSGVTGDHRGVAAPSAAAIPEPGVIELAQQ